MDFVFNVIGMPFNGETLKSKSLGGSESAGYYMARELARRGHRVTVFTTSQEEGIFDGVQYCFCGDITQNEPLGSRFNFYATTTPHDVLLIQRHPLAFHRDYAAKVNVWQLHDLALFRTQGMIQGGLPRIDLTLAVSRFHADQIEKVYGIKGNAIKVVPNGVDPDLYVVTPTRKQFDDSLAAIGITNDRKQFRILYQSRPERGLEHLVRPGGIMDRLRETRAHLFYCSYDHVHESMAGYYAQLNDWASALPNVTNVGSLTKHDLAKLQQSCDLMMYPTEFEEVSCITVMEAMHARLPVVTSAHGALPETCKDAGVELLPLIDGHADENAFVAFANMVMLDLDDVTRERVSVLGRMKEAQAAASASRTWAHAADEFLMHLSEHFASRHRNADRIARHCIEHADIAFLDWVSATTDEPSDISTPIFEATLNERRTMYEFVENPSKHVAHYEFWEGDNLDRLDAHGFDARREIDGVKNMTRFVGIRGLLAIALDAHKEDRPLRVLEFGCAHGHISLALAETFGNAIQITGMDFMGRSVVKAAENAVALGLTNASFRQGDVDALEDLTPDGGGYDVVIAAEVIEHIYDYLQALNALRGVIADDGMMIFTTPTGRWEWTGHENFPKGREHLHHFERDDWLDIVAEFDDPQVMFAPAGTDGTGGGLGSWVVGVKAKDGAAFRAVDYRRKLAVLAPRETVSLCMIAKDSEHTIGRAISSVIQYVDEVVIGIDGATTDETRAVIGRIAARWPFVPFHVFDNVRALESGFDAARNATLDRATGDWIMWMDSDEEVPQPHNLWRLLRPSNFNAYACPQIHYSAMPAQVLTSDFPCRLFRATRGVRFYGLVHEHPEDEPGKSITPAAMATDLQFMHAGYVDEPTRRRRYHRNLPLLVKDCEEHPTRLLNKFLMLRDIAQGIQFDAMANRQSSEHGAQANRGLALFDELLANKDVPLRMVIDGVQYASVCNELLQQGFVAKFTWQTQRPPFDTMSTEGTADGRFKDRAIFTKLINRIIEESTQHYESPYA